MNVSVPGMQPGIWYGTRLRVRGCANRTLSAYSDGVICDETGPLVLATPTIAAPDGKAVLAYPGYANVSYFQVSSTKQVVSSSHLANASS